MEQFIITNPKLLAIAQIIIALGVLASIVEPWVVRWPRVHAVVSRLAGVGLDVRKAIAGAKKPEPTVDPNVANGSLVAFFAAVAFGSMLVIVAFTPGCGLTAADAGKVAGCGAAYDACFTAAFAMPADKPTKMAAYAVCRAQVDGKCLGMFDPPPPVATATAPSVAPVSAPPVASAPPPPAPSTSAAPAASALP